MNVKNIIFSIFGGIVLTMLSGLFSNMPSMLVGATHYGYPLAWLIRLVIAPMYFPWRINVFNLVADIGFWAVIVGIVVSIIHMYSRKNKKTMVLSAILLVIFIAIVLIGIQYYHNPNGFEGNGMATIEGLAEVNEIEINILESFPVQVNVIARGNLSDSCTKIKNVSIAQEGNVFSITITTSRPTDSICAQVITPFEEVMELDVIGLKAGIYVVEVNGVTSTFELQVDNILQS